MKDYRGHHIDELLLKNIYMIHLVKIDIYKKLLTEIINIRIINNLTDSIFLLL